MSDVVHKDKLGKEIHLGGFVAFPNHNSLSIGKVIKSAKAMVILYDISTKYSKYRKYPIDCIVLDDKDVTWHLLKSGSPK